MIVIIHHPSDWNTMPDVEWERTDPRLYEADFAYLVGYAPPNYPVPAIRMQPDWTISNRKSAMPMFWINERDKQVSVLTWTTQLNWLKY